LHQPPWSFGFDSQTRGTRENRSPPCLEVPGSSRVPAPPWVGSRSPDGWDQIPRWAGGWFCTSHPGALGLIPKREEPGKTGRHPVLKYRVPHGSHHTQLYNRSCSNKHTHGHMGSLPSLSDGQTSAHRPWLVISRSTCPPISPPHTRKQRRLWRTPLVSCPRRRPTRRRASPAPLSAQVVNAGPFSLFVLRKHFITEIFLKKKSGDVNDEVKFSFFILLHKRAKPTLLAQTMAGCRLG
jgi:hypothetical protein